MRQISRGFNVLIILTLPLIKLRHVYARASVPVSSLNTEALQIINQLEARLPRGFQNVRGGGGGGGGGVRATPCSSTRELIAAHHSRTGPRWWGAEDVQYREKPGAGQAARHILTNDARIKLNF